MPQRLWRSSRESAGKLPPTEAVLGEARCLLTAGLPRDSSERTVEGMQSRREFGGSPDYPAVHNPAGDICLWVYRPDHEGR